MLLHKLTLQDFGAYRGIQTLSLTTTPQQPIVLIGGMNGCGKTTLLDALQLVLYGPRARCSGRVGRSYETYLRECINRSADQAVGASIELEFSVTEEGVENVYRVRRAWASPGKGLSEYVDVQINNKQNKVISDSWADHVEDILPLEIGSLFFFDGEKIESLADPDRASAVIESAVHSLLGVNVVQQLRTDLLALQRRQKLTGEEEQATREIRDLEKEHADIHKAVGAAHMKTAEVKSALDVAEKALKKAERAFQRDGGNLYERRRELQDRHDQAKDAYEAVEESLVSLAAGPLPLLLLSDQIANAHKQATLEKDAHDSAQVVQVLNNRDKSIIDRLRTVMSTDELDSLSSYLQDDRLHREHAANTEQVLALNADGYAQLLAVDQVLAHETRRARELLEQAEDYATNRARLKQQLDGVPDESVIATRIADLEEAKSNVARLNAALDAAVDEHKNRKNQLAGIEAQLTRAHETRVEALVRADEVKRIIDHCERQREILGKYGAALLDRHVNQLEVAVLASFTTLMRKQGLVTDLHIDTERFQLTLIGSNDEEIDPARLSAGERQLLAVSLLWGLARVAGNWLPSVIDTPLGRLDSRHREHLVDRYFPNASHQVLLLSTDEEIDENLLHRLKPHLSRTYTLVHDDTTFSTSVQPGYWWTSGAEHVA
ncbi:DNA sulfur modification protein DndD [Nocardia brasiliensis]|uniref:DNA sulfur modification protein DndD n=1 Tax=Nocardia brasiliensis TaxID=37326 RepID=UPI001895DB33|nr:DNA sulfur modification protein DndD [Nocardia brasiliensis]MBF6547607.1 DNA sulfur modification protein DndD [Nocardia brasiliensis]